MTFIGFMFRRVAVMASHHNHFLFFGTFMRKSSSLVLASCASQSAGHNRRLGDLFHTDEHAVFKFGASDDRRQSLRGNSLVMWSAIEHLAQKGFEKLHLGRTSCEHYG